MPYKNKEDKLKHDREYYYKHKKKIILRKTKHHKCLNCDNLVSMRAKKCASCSYKARNWKGNHISLDARKRLSNKMKEYNPMKKTEISTKVRDSNRQKGVYAKNSMKMINGGALKARMANNFSPNKPEKIIINLLNENNMSFEYVGGGKIWFRGNTQYFNPDFINRKEKLIIEFFGFYWHKGTYEKDKERLETYSKKGYKTLIIWDNELKNFDKIIEKIKVFKNGN